MAQPSFFDTENRLKKLDEKDNLLKLNNGSIGAYSAPQ